MLFSVRARIREMQFRLDETLFYDPKTNMHAHACAVRVRAGPHACAFLLCARIRGMQFRLGETLF